MQYTKEKVLKHIEIKCASLQGRKAKSMSEHEHANALDEMYGLIAGRYNALYDLEDLRAVWEEAVEACRERAYTDLRMPDFNL